ncbi:P450-derived glycosyltransferase activator [Amycolatopsis sp. cmx-11-12]|uniref:cytochrome P450 family protein n=1 Tax=Amycolatopsis sp. cmx-11-12 TaxID=2785795 RepID=UPI003917CB2B
MVLAAEGLGRRLQLTQGIQWLYGANGDAYASMLRGYDDDPFPGYERVREQGELWQSRVGTWVTAHHHVGTELVDHPALGMRRADGTSVVQQVTPLDEAFFNIERPELDRFRELTAPVLGPGAASRYLPDVERICERILDDVEDEFDLIEKIATAVPVELVAELSGLSAPGRERLVRDCAAATVALDSLLCPQKLVHTLKMYEAIADLRTLFGREAAGSESHLLSELPNTADAQAVYVLLAVAGARVACELIGNAMLALFDHRQEWDRMVHDPDRASLVVRETLRFDPPVRLHATVAHSDFECAGQRIEAGSSVVVLVGGANRDPKVFENPGRFDHERETAPARPLLPGSVYHLVTPLARVQAEGVLRVLASRLPGLRRSGPPLRRRRASTTRGLLRLPASKS